MKNKILKIGMNLFFILYGFVLFAQPGNNNGDGDLEGDDAPAAPINGKIIFLAIAGILFAYFTIRNRRDIASTVNH